ncbi:efflux RND transporter periplasmic adaptor subunit [Rasiella sp. SM2506]|uniref:efflux RND transporter periplasmic adaptor subunit n=1 Tax=Rasiella sp. SM2506 TaxID=3423914 RepID=UPI003D7B3755
MRKLILYGLGVAILVIAFFGSKYLIDNNTKEKPEIAKIIKTVFAEPVTNSTVPIVIPANGTLQAKNRFELYSEVQGVFQGSANDFKAGQPYSKGQALIRINAAEYYASVQASKSEFYNLVTSLMPDFRLDYPDSFSKWQTYLDNFDVNKSVPALPEITSDKVKYFVTGRGVYAAYYNLKNLEQRLGKYNIYAPYSGILTEALVTKGTLIRQGQKLGEYIDTSVFELELAIGKTFSDLLKLGEKVELSVPQSSKTYTGTVSRVNGRIDPDTQTIKVFVEVKGDDLKEGMYLEAQLEAREQTNAIKISRKLLVDESEIFIVRDSILDLIKVEPVYFSPKEVVVQGVPDGTVVLLKSIPGAYAGMLVKVNRDSAPASNETETTE